MIPVLGNPAGLWLLLGVPAILAVHFLQQRVRVAPTSTWFLIETLAPDSARGRTWDRLRTSRTLWLQLLAILVGTWVLIEPRWVRAESAQTVVLVLDTSASMEAFREPALAAARREMTLAGGLAARTTWVVMTTDPRQPALYRGTDANAAGAALSEWRPELGAHDFAPALRVARGLAGVAGRTLLITDKRAKLPPDQRVAGVGHPIDNVGFAGATVTRVPAGHAWRALVRNHAAVAQQRGWFVESATGRSDERTVQLAPGALVEISGVLADGADEATIVFSGDGFTADDRLPLVRPAAKALVVAVEGEDDAAEFFRRVGATVDGVRVVGADTPATLRLGRLSAADVAQEARGGIFWPPADRRAQVPLLPEPVTPERHPLVAGLNWQGLLGAGPYGFTTAAEDAVLLWQGGRPLVFERHIRPPVADEAQPDGARPAPPAPAAVASAPSGEARKLMLALDWDTSNAARLPATVLLVRRYLEVERDRQRAPFAANFDCGAPVFAEHAAGAAVAEGETMLLEFRSVAGGPPRSSPLSAAAVAALRAPGRAGFFTVRRGDELVVRGTAQFADPRQGDFRDAETFFVEVRAERAAALERNTVADPFRPIWLVLLAGLMLGSWWMRSAPRAAPRAPVTRAETVARLIG